jgi:imidazolonepropionase-like amidohydrolase
MQADIVATKEDPLQDISVLKKIAFVMKLGTVYKNQ